MELKFILEAILFNTQRPLSLSELRDIFSTTAEQSEAPAAKPLKKIKEPEISSALAQLEKEHQDSNRSFHLVCVAGGWQFVSQPEYAPWLKTLVGARNRPARLTQPALETLAIIAYRQPITRAEIEQIRGVAVDGVVATLLERGLIEQVGRAEVVGRPMTYGTTLLFLEYFGLRDLEHLPEADELRRIFVERPATLVTAEPGLATTPPDLANGGSEEGVNSAPPATDPGQGAPAPMASSPRDTDSLESNPQSSLRNLQSE